MVSTDLGSELEIEVLTRISETFASNDFLDICIDIFVKGLLDDMTLEFFLVSYDDVGGIACRRVAELCKPFSVYAPVFWTSNTTFIESPLSLEEENIYESRMHIQPLAEADDPCEIMPTSDKRVIMCMLHMNSSYDLVIPDLARSTVNPRQAEGRIWQYENGTFGFGFLRDNYIIDLRRIAQNGQILDVADFSSCWID